MAKGRYINTKFWDDEYIGTLSPMQRYLFLYILTNSLTNLSGIYEITLKRISFDTGMTQEEIQEAFDRFSQAGKIYYAQGWLWIKNFQKHQSPSIKIQQGIAYQMQDIPKNILDLFAIEIPEVASRESKKPVAKAKPAEPEVLVKPVDLTPKEKAVKFFTEPETQELVITKLFGRGITEDVARSKIREFVRYWTELNATGKKQRWEMEPTFDINGRLGRWFANSKEFNNSVAQANRAETL